ncbi:MAG: ATP-binding protein [Anaerolineae bacterium]|nr:ATP-binding protein [Anaerolineae bacterium]
MVELLREREVAYLVTGPEGQTLELKSARIHPRDLATTLIAFANADGGRLLVGIEDDGTVSGLDPIADREQVERLLRAAYEYCTPSVQIEYQFVPYQGRQVLVVDVPVSTRVHSHTNGRVYLRVLDRDQPLSADETLRVAFAKGQASYETQPVRGATLEDVDQELVEEYARLRGLDQPAERILRGLNLLVEDTLTVAGVLLFAREPARWMPRAGVDFLKFEGATVELGEAFNLVKREELTAPLPRLVRRTWDLVGTFVRTRRRLRGLEMIEQPEYPDFAWREVIVNAIAHRDYSITGTAIQVRMFDDRLEVESPGGLPGIVTVENIRYRHFSRNPHIVGVLKAWRYMEELGFGIDRVFREMEAVGAPPPLITDEGGVVTVTLYAIEPVIPADVARLGLNERQAKVLLLLTEREKITNREYRELFSVSNATAYADLTELMEKDLIERIGIGRGVFYRLIKRNNLMQT